MTEPASFDPETQPTVTLGGRNWPIPELLGWRQLSRCRQQLLGLNSRIAAAAKASPAPPDADDEALVLHNVMVMSDVFTGLSNDEFDDLVQGPLFAALSALHPKLTREEFDGWPVTESERQFALLTVRRCSGLFVFGAPETAPDEEPPPGEAQGAA